MMIMANSLLTPNSANIFEDLGFSPEESENLLIRADLMLSIRRRIKNQNWTTTDGHKSRLPSSPRSHDRC